MEALRVAARQPEVGAERSRHVAVVGPGSVDGDGLAGLEVFELVEVGVPPLERAGGADHAEAVVVLRADRDLRGRHRGDRAVVQLGEDREVVVEGPSGDDRLHPRRELHGAEPGDEADELVGVRPDVAPAAGGARLGRVGAPGGLLAPLVLALGGQPALGIPGLDLADLADQAVAHELAREHDHRVAGVRVGDDERDLRSLHGRVEPPRLFEVGRQGLLAEDGDAGARGGLRGAGVGVVGGDDRQVVDALALGERGLAGDQIPPMTVAAGEEQLLGGGEGLVRPAPERPGGQFRGVVHQDRPAVGRPEEAARPAPADHPHPQLSSFHRRWPSDRRGHGFYGPKRLAQVEPSRSPGGLARGEPGRNGDRRPRGGRPLDGPARTAIVACTVAEVGGTNGRARRPSARRRA